MRNHFAALGLTLAWLAGAAVAHAQSAIDMTEARRVFDEATSLFEEGNFALSLQSFERSHALMAGHANQYLILFNIGRCQEELGRIDDAIATYERYLGEGGATYDNGEETRRRVRELRERRRMGAAGTGGTSGLLIAGIVLEATGGIAGIASLVTGLVAHDLYTGLEARCVPADACPPGSAEDISTGSALSWTSTILLPVAAVAIGVGTALLVIDLSSGESASSAQLELIPTLGGAHLRGRF